MKRVYFTVVLFILVISNLYARANMEKTYEYPNPRQYVINMSKEEMFSKLQNIVNIYDDGNYTYIPVRMYFLRPNGGRNSFAGIWNDRLEDDWKYGAATFFLQIQYANNSIFLKKCRFIIDENSTYNFIPDKIEIENIFFNNIVKYLLEEEIFFEYLNYESTELINTIKNDIILIYKNFLPFSYYITIFQSVPAYGDFRTRSLTLSSSLNIEIINSILEFEWISKKIEFPTGYLFNRNPDYEIIMQSGSYPYIDLRIAIWKNVNQYFAQVQLGPIGEFVSGEYYSIDVNKLNEILHLMNVEI
jgi:hypothetical protein